MEKKVVKIEYTETVRICLSEIASHLTQSDVDPAPVLAEILDQYEQRVSLYPYGCQSCPELLKMGVSKYRECNTANGYRVIYSAENSVVTTHAILAHKQDIKQLLFRRLINA
ncbi:MULTISPECIES: type II toxin-antitoxin system RelE/ParE family toxin [Enterobacter]|uniref:type II toxin-antitoxin system RelE/ParE family toxin n=1 Tax=Enterobacter TaxID=547 RepID=UPI001ABEAE70|nr:type II toxin-antitoxin system RelE/ParE family toxin [Enterobacter kobei]MBO4154568.1 type II toxin-antitoxin system RelE/ParE family toxin [Enterobacter kobei]UOY68634.1 type II toxin-antitoxin system RelE/ParE family toxin [Enterobacter kobei]